jgi:hypothetical protein
MHDRTRRQLCRTAFIFFCVLPAAGIFIWTGWRGGQSHQRACAAELSHSIGLGVTCQSISYPRPGIVRYQGVVLNDPETAAPLARMRFLESGGNAGSTIWIASQTELDAVRLRSLWQLVDSWLREANDGSKTAGLRAAEATLSWPDGSNTLTDVNGQISLPSQAGGERTASLSFRIAGLDMQEPVRLSVTRQRDGSGSANSTSEDSRLKTRVELHTAGAALPCELLAVPLGITNHLGRRATFRGSLWAVQSADGWEGELAGQFSNVDLKSLVSEQFPHRLSGSAEITVRQARFCRGRLESAEGTFSAGPGTVSQSLVSSAIQNLKLVPSDASNHADEMLRRYDQLSLEFLVNQAGLTLHGQCSGASGIVVRFADRTVLSEAGRASGPLVALVRTLVPQSEVQVPATRESDWLIERMPVPTAILPQGEAVRGRLRLERDGEQ